MSQIITLEKNGLVARIDTKGAQLVGLALDGREALPAGRPHMVGKELARSIPAGGNARI